MTDDGSAVSSTARRDGGPVDLPLFVQSFLTPCERSSVVSSFDGPATESGDELDEEPFGVREGIVTWLRIGEARGSVHLAVDEDPRTDIPPQAERLHGGFGDLRGYGCVLDGELAIDFDGPAAVGLVERAALTWLDQRVIAGRMEDLLCPARDSCEKADREEFDPADIADRFVAWYDTGPFDIGGMTARSLRELKRGASWNEAGQQVWEESPEGSNAGNGSVMRCPPLAIQYANNRERLLEVSKQSSRITHADPRCTYGCAVLNLTIAGILGDADAPLQDALDYVSSNAPDELVAALRPVACGDSPAMLETSGYVVHSLQTALYDGLLAESAEEAIVTAVNRGGDADTIGAIAGAVAGARFGASSLPDRWRDATDETSELEDLAERLLEVA